MALDACLPSAGYGSGELVSKRTAMPHGKALSDVHRDRCRSDVSQVPLSNAARRNATERYSTTNARTRDRENT